MKVLHPKIWVITPKNEGFGFPWLPLLSMVVCEFLPTKMGPYILVTLMEVEIPVHIAILDRYLACGGFFNKLLPVIRGFQSLLPFNTVWHFPLNHDMGVSKSKGTPKWMV